MKPETKQNGRTVTMLLLHILPKITSISLAHVSEQQLQTTTSGPLIDAR
jgi:hypothetical protein